MRNTVKAAGSFAGPALLIAALLPGMSAAENTMVEDGAGRLPDTSAELALREKRTRV